MKIFVDTSAFIALEVRSDSQHFKAREVYENLTAGDRLYTSNYIIDETITRLRYTIGHMAAVSFAEAVLGGRLYEVIYIDPDLERLALNIMRKYKDKKLSFTDCTSMALVRHHRLDAVFAFDEDFVTAGFRVVP